MIGLMLSLQLLITTKPLPVKHYPRDTTTNYIVLHADESPNYKVTRNTLVRRGNSYHFYIERTGKVIQFLDTQYEGGHAGLSYWKGHIRMNLYSIGICLQDMRTKYYTKEQYKSLARLVVNLQHIYKDSTAQEILTHSMIAVPRGRKSDPNGFDWKIFNKNLEQAREEWPYKDTQSNQSRSRIR